LPEPHKPISSIPLIDGSVEEVKKEEEKKSKSQLKKEAKKAKKQ
jgi:hypothetical protein